MVVTVALVRLFLGTLIGLTAGWATGSIGHWLDILITGALAVPVFIVTLGAIAMLGAEMGLMAFVIGFSINGWGETARVVREQTQTIKENLYIEASQALGAPRRHVIFAHILRQIMPMIWMLLAFEISNTLMVTAGLGFLGYYIGGDVWIEVGDFVSRRISGKPELGQMLATSWTHLTKPWPMVITGTIIFITILGFNLLGEGLRISLNPEIVKMKNPFRDKAQRLSWWWEEQVSLSFGKWARAHPLVLLLVSVLVIVAGSAFYWWRTQIYPQTTTIGKTLSVPGDHLWGAERGDPYGTNWSDSLGPDQPNVEWQFQAEAGFSGGPAISTDQTVYIGAKDGRLLALQPDGQIIWELALPETPVGSPALSPEGTVYIGD
jgi:peptide/nickel transport system permease protein